jgi:hypothetical protein
MTFLSKGCSFKPCIQHHKSYGHKYINIYNYPNQTQQQNKHYWFKIKKFKYVNS